MPATMIETIHDNLDNLAVTVVGVPASSSLGCSASSPGGLLG